MKKCCFVIPYFGRFPNYFQLFLTSCRYNPEFNWLVFTDDMTAYDYPLNVTRIQMSFAELQALVRSKFDFTTGLQRPYKLCDFKPTYGYLFEDYLSDYRFWGHCDIDLLMGHLARFITDDLLAAYDKLFCLGHMVLYRNTPENNRRFMADLDGVSLYREALAATDYQSFDEDDGSGRCINDLWLRHGWSVFQQDWSLNFFRIYVRFHRTYYYNHHPLLTGSGYVVEDYKDTVCLWNKGHVERYYIDAAGALIREEYMYVHLQKRAMQFNPALLQADVVNIVPNYFLPFRERQVTKENFASITKNPLTLHILKLHMRYLIALWRFKLSRLLRRK